MIKGITQVEKGDLCELTEDTLAGLTGNIAYWSTMALNIPDFSRYAKSQKSQFRGQLTGMPIPMLICALVGAVFAQAT